MTKMQWYRIINPLTGRFIVALQASSERGAKATATRKLGFRQFGYIAVLFED